MHDEKNISSVVWIVPNSDTEIQQKEKFNTIRLEHLKYFSI